MDAERPRKVYQLTNDGKTVLNFTENSLNLICKNIAKDDKISIDEANFSMGSRTQKLNMPITLFAK